MWKQILQLISFQVSFINFSLSIPHIPPAPWVMFLIVIHSLIFSCLTFINSPLFSFQILHFLLLCVSCLRDCLPHPYQLHLSLIILPPQCIYTVCFPLSVPLHLCTQCQAFQEYHLFHQISLDSLTGFVWDSWTCGTVQRTSSCFGHHCNPGCVINGERCTMHN